MANCDFTKRVLVITGTPGVGKTFYARFLGKMLGAEVVSANEVAKNRGCILGKGKYGAMLIDMKKLAKELNKIAARSKSELIVFEGHLLCDLSIKGAVAVVLREHLPTLLKRQSERKFSNKKINENLVAEATDYCGQHARKHYSKVYELLSSAKSTPKQLIAIAKGKGIKEASIELLPELLGIMKKQRKFNI